MSSSATTTGRWPQPWPSPSCCCSPVPSPSTSTTTCARSRAGPLHVTQVLVRTANGALLRHRAAASADRGADRLFVQRLTAGERMERLLDALVHGAAAQPPAARVGIAVTRGRRG